MKKMRVILAAGMLGVMAGCTTPTALRAPVGPDPLTAKNADQDGTLQVFTAMVERSTVGFEFPYTQRTDYVICDSNGKEINRIHNNNQGHFEGTPRAIRLAPGTYKIKALAAVGLGEWIAVPVVIEPGRTTEVHLNGQWKPPADTPEDEMVRAPGGFPMGWRANSAPNG